MARHMTISEAFEAWQESIRPIVIEQYGEDDYPAMSESWNDYTDSLCKDGSLNDLQYHYCPSFDDDIPDDDCPFILEQMNVQVSHVRIAKRPDGLMSDMDNGAKHYRVLIKRNNAEMTFFYSMGSAHTNPPDACDVINCLLMDTSDIESIEFEEWAENLGFDADSRKAEKIFKACQKQLLELRLLLSDSELDDLREIFADY